MHEEKASLVIHNNHTKEQEEISGNDGYVYYLERGDGFVGVYMYVQTY